MIHIPRASELDAVWNKASYSAGEGNCVEVADIRATHGVLAVRDSKDEGGPALTFASAAFTAFVDDAASGRYGI